ncbi:MAG: sulfatase [Saonia sp.]
MSYLKSILFCCTALLMFGCRSKGEDKPKNGNNAIRPNIIFILADDYGYMDTQAYASKVLPIAMDSTYYETPHINALMAEGVSFSQAYANQLCSPTRASILTGKYAGRLGFTTAMPLRQTYYNQNMDTPEGYYAHDVLEHKDNIMIEQALVNATSNSAVPTGTDIDSGRDELSIAEALKDYHSAFIGKWHIGGFGAKGYQPADQGFEALAWFDAGGSAYYDWRKGWNNASKERFPKMPQEKWELGYSGKMTDNDYLTDDLTQQALDFIEKRAAIKGKPFFLYFSHFAVHAPYQGKEDEILYFDKKDTKGWNGHRDPIYASMIKSMDRSVGQILEKLKRTGLEENTFVVFMSDNGGIDSKITPKGDGTDNSPFLGGKACLTEGGIRVPLIFRWKGRIPEGKWVDVPVDCTDIYPTILEAAGYDAKTIANTHSLDGQSVIPLLSDIKNSRNAYTKETHYWHYPFNVIYNSPYEPYALTPHSAIRDGDYKLIFDWYGRVYLYNIEQDPYEKIDLASQLPKVKDMLFNKLMDWLKLNVDQRYWPSFNEDYDAGREVRKTPFVNLFSIYKE